MTHTESSLTIASCITPDGALAERIGDTLAGFGWRRWPTSRHTLLYVSPDEQRRLILARLPNRSPNPLPEWLTPCAPEHSTQSGVDMRRQ
ncbi:hypothetical protein ACFWOX_07610 [Streptomyces sp. NPDC058467]|uniref:hypothetical protein n=1 Tax=Streptomyces sp. NPDC058467 TaxID=3346513 RepID=UPI00365C27F5